jgi:hypothetical protein
MMLLMTGCTATPPALTFRMAAHAAVLLVGLIEPIAFPLVNIGLFPVC